MEAFIPMKTCDYRCSRGTMCVPCLLGEECFPAVAQPNSVIRTRSSTCPLNMQPTSPSLIIQFAKQTQKGPLSKHRAAPRRPAVDAPLELPKRRRGQRQNHASDRALTPQTSPRLHPDPSPGQRDADQGRPGQDLQQLLPLEWPDGLDA